MKAYLVTSGSIFALFGLSHLLIIVEHWRYGHGPDFWWIGGPALIGVLGAALAVWAFRLVSCTRA